MVTSISSEKNRGVPKGHPKLELLASNGMVTFVIPFNITLRVHEAV